MLRFLTVACSAAVLLLAGCGDDDEARPDSTGDSSHESAQGDALVDDDAAIREVVTALLMENDQGICDEAMTQRYIDQNYPPAGEGALADCRALQSPDLKVEADSVRFERIEVTGDRGTASAEAVGADVGGAVVKFALVRAEEGEWRLDRVERVEIVDREQFEQALRAEGTGGSAQLGEAQAGCIANQVAKLPETEVERRLARTPAVPVAVLISCLGDGTAVGAVASLVRDSLEGDPETEPISACSTAVFSGDLAREDALAFLRAEDRETVRNLTSEALEECGA